VTPCPEKGAIHVVTPRIDLAPPAQSRYGADDVAGQDRLIDLLGRA
jgi:hypothetical protein